MFSEINSIYEISLLEFNDIAVKSAEDQTACICRLILLYTRCKIYLLSRKAGKG